LYLSLPSMHASLALCHERWASMDAMRPSTDVHLHVHGHDTVLPTTNNTMISTSCSIYKEAQLALCCCCCCCSCGVTSRSQQQCRLLMSTLLRGCHVHTKPSTPHAQKLLWADKQRATVSMTVAKVTQGSHVQQIKAGQTACNRTCITCCS
jgi:hypothetical protein